MTALTSSPPRCLRRAGLVADPWARLVCFPHAGGTASFYRGWREDLPADVELCSVQYPGRLDRIAEPGAPDMDRLADEIAHALAALSDRPLALFGHSMGAAVAYEAALRLPALTGRSADLLLVSGRCAPHRARPGSKHLAPDEVLWAEVRRLGGTAPEVLDNPEVRDAMLPALRGDYRLIETYRPRPGEQLTAPIAALLGDGDPDVDRDEIGDWAGCTRAGFSLRVFPGDHFYLVPRRAEVVGEILARLADAVPRPRRGPDGP